MSETFSRIIALPLDDPKHASFRVELWLVHAEHGCRYYLSILADRDYYLAHRDAFEKDFSNYLSANASPMTRCWRDSFYRFDFALPLLREAFYSTATIPRKSKASKADRALILLLMHPDWDDATIIEQLKTTSKQLTRWTMFRLARREQDRSVIEA